ncbi:MAG: hypothetical protein AB8G99_23745 [Planctomycetaceae bacterium]
MTWVSENIKPIGFVTLLVLIGMVFRGCGGPGEVGPRTYEYTQTLTQILQRRDDPRLPKTRAEALTEVRDQVSVAVDSGEMSESDSQLLLDIIQSAVDGDEDSAKASLRVLLRSSWLGV